MKEHSDSKEFSEDDIIKVLELLVDIFVVFAGKVYHETDAFQWVRISPIFLHSYEAEFISSQREGNS